MNVVETRNYNVFSIFRRNIDSSFKQTRSHVYLRMSVRIYKTDTLPSIIIELAQKNSCAIFSTLARGRSLSTECVLHPFFVIVSYTLPAILRTKSSPRKYDRNTISNKGAHDRIFPVGTSCNLNAEIK